MYKGQQVEVNFGRTTGTSSHTSSRLDMRFAEEEDSVDIECLLQIADACEYDEESEYYFRMPNSRVPGAPSSLNVRVSTATIEQDCSSGDNRWIVMETPVPEEQVVGAARLIFNPARDEMEPKKVVVDIFCCAPDTHMRSVRSQMLAQIERVAVSRGAETLVIHVSQHRMDTQAWFEECGYKDLGGFACEDAGLLKPTMIFEYHKNLRLARAQTVTYGASIASTAGDSQPKEPSTHSTARSGSVDAADLGSLTLEDLEIVDTIASSVAPTEMRGLMTDLFAALHREHKGD